jgi:hypothetical protein
MPGAGPLWTAVAGAIASAESDAVGRQSPHPWDSRNR